MSLEQLVVGILILLLLGGGIAALTVLCDVLFARFVRRARAVAAQMPVRALLVGVINFLFFGVIAFGLFAIAQEAENSGADGFAGIIRLLALAVVLVLSSFLALGLTASARWVGEKIAPDASAVRQIIFGIIVLELASLAPLVGWIVVPLAATLVGYGAVIVALVRRKSAGQ
jgi:hypothetical protein